MARTSDAGASGDLSAIRVGLRHGAPDAHKPFHSEGRSVLNLLGWGCPVRLAQKLMFVGVPINRLLRHQEVGEGPLQSVEELWTVLETAAEREISTKT